MLELFPEGFEEPSAATSVELVAYTTPTARSAPARGVRRGRQRADVAGRLGGRAGASSTGPSGSARCGSGRPGRRRPGDALAVVIDPGRAFGTGAHPTTRLCLELLLELAARERCSTSAAARACSRSPRPGSASRRCSRSTSTRRRSRRPRDNAARNGVAIDVRRADALGDPLPDDRRRRSRTSSSTSSSALASRAVRAARRHVGLPRPRTSPTLAGLRPRRAPRARRVGCRSLRVASVASPVYDPAVATFSVRFLGCKVSHADAHAIRERLLARRPRRGRRRRRRRRRQHLLRHARGGAEVAPGGGARGAARTGASTSPAAARTSPGRVRRAAARTSPSSRGGARRRPAFVAGDVGAIGCVQADARLDRVRAFVKIQDGCSFSCNFCVIPLVRGASRSRRAEAVLAEVRRRVAQGHREVVLTGINLGCFRDREAGYGCRGSCARPARRRASRRLRLSSIEVNHVDDELVAALRETPTVVAAPARPAPVGRRRRARARWAAATRPRRTSGGSSRSTDFNLTTRRDRRLSRRGRARVRAHARDVVASAGHHEGARLPVLAAPGHAHRGGGPGAAGGEEASAARGCGAVSTRRCRAPLAREARARGRRARRPAGPRVRRRLLALARRRARSASSSRVRAAAVTRGGDRRVPLTDCLFCRLVREGDHVRTRRRLRRDRGHRPAGGRPPAGAPRAARRHVPRGRRVPGRGGEADARVRRRDGARGRPRGLPRRRQRRPRAAARRSSTCTGTSSAARLRGMPA